jgi:hypothetical protein
LRERQGWELFVYVLGILCSYLLLAVPRRWLLRYARGLLQSRFYPACRHVLFHKSGRSALSAVFCRVAAQRSNGCVLIPDYVCNVVSRAVSQHGLVPVTYATSGNFSIDMADLENRLQDPRVVAAVLASIFGAQNRSQPVLDRIRKTRPDIVIVVDDCQNLATGVPFVPDDRTVVVFSFNMKNICGTMGGGLCFSTDFLQLEEPGAGCVEGLLLELRLHCMLLLQLAEQTRRAWRAIAWPLGPYRRPPLEYSPCARPQYDMAVQRIAKLSLVRAIQGIHDLAHLEKRRQYNVGQLQRYLAATGLGEVIATERVEIAPFVPLRSQASQLVGLLPLKGPYALDAVPSRSIRPELIAFQNQGIGRIVFHPGRPDTH